MEMDKGKENIEALENIDPIKKMDNMVPPILNGFIPPLFLDASDISNAFPNDVPKVPNGLLPPPLMPPMSLIPSMPLPPGLPHGSPLRGLIPPPPPPPPCGAGFVPGLPQPPMLPFVSPPTPPPMPLQTSELPPPPRLPTLHNGNVGQDGEPMKDDLKMDGDVKK